MLALLATKSGVVMYQLYKALQIVHGRVSSLWAVLTVAICIFIHINDCINNDNDDDEIALKWNPINTVTENMTVTTGLNWAMSNQQIDSMLLCVCSVINHRWRQNVVRRKKWHTRR